MERPSLSANDLACRRGERVLFAGVSFVLEAGDALRIAGPNGSGKTSLMRIVAGLLKPLAGKVRRSGSLGLVDERPAFDPEMPLGRALRFWACMDGQDSSTMYATTDRVGLGELLDVPVGYLSTGQKKRAALARLVVQNSPIWLLDEPLNGLDNQGVALVEKLVDAHRAAGGVALIASHQPWLLANERTIAINTFAP